MTVPYVYRRFFIAVFFFIADFFRWLHFGVNQQIPIFKFMMFSQQQIPEEVFQIAFILDNPLLDIGVVRTNRLTIIIKTNRMLTGLLSFCIM